MLAVLVIGKWLPHNCVLHLLTAHTWAAIFLITVDVIRDVFASPTSTILVQKNNTCVLRPYLEQFYMSVVVKSLVSYNLYYYLY
jgi:hypothetical protein